jgi:hypothetical protein
MNASFERHVNSWPARLCIVGAVGLFALCAGGWFQARQFFVSYLYAYFFWLGLGVGCALIAMIHHLTGGEWGHPVRRFLEAGAATLPLMAILFVPICFGLRELYPWARSNAGPDVLKKAAYLNSEFFIARAIVYFSIWSFLGWKLRALSRAQDDSPDTEPSHELQRLSGLGLVIVPITATFAYIDWIMSLEPAWHSTVFALTLLAGQILMSYCFVIVLLRLFGQDASLVELVTRQRFHQLGNLTLTFVLFWTYLAFSQLLIIYSGNKPEEIGWYLHRIHGAWKAVIIVIALFHFLLPFLILLFRRSKRSGASLAMISRVLFATHLLYTYWIVKPSFAGLRPSWLDLVAPIGIGAIWLATFFTLLKRAPLVPRNDPRMLEELAYAEH